MKEIMIFIKGGKVVVTKIPQKYIDEGLVLYWIDCVCELDVTGWFDYRIGGLI